MCCPEGHVCDSLPTWGWIFREILIFIKVFWTLDRLKSNWILKVWVFIHSVFKMQTSKPYATHYLSVCLSIGTRHCSIVLYWWYSPSPFSAFYFQIRWCLIALDALELGAFCLQPAWRACTSDQVHTTSSGSKHQYWHSPKILPWFSLPLQGEDSFLLLEESVAS